VFNSYVIESAANNVINLEVPLQGLHRALKSAVNATSASIRLTKQDGLPMLCLTITTTSMGAPSIYPSTNASMHHDDDDDPERGMSIDFTNNARERETVITQHIPIRVLSTDSVNGLHEPRTKEPDVHIAFPPLNQLKSISDRFTKLAQVAKQSQVSGLTSIGPRLELAANMHGCLRIRIVTDSMNIKSTWTGLSNPRLDPDQVEGGEEAIRNHPTTRMRALGDASGNSDEGWSKVLIDGRDWSKVMSVGRMGGQVIACG
jgi:HUS1 checkpoint protein